MTDDLGPAELEPVGGSWSGLLFENTATGYPLSLTWSFSVVFAEVVRDFGTVTPNLTIDWVPAGDSTWASLANRQFRSTTFGSPIEASVYFFEHHRFDAAEVVVGNQRGGILDVDVAVWGDIDGLGIPGLDVAATVTFAGIFVQTDRVGVDLAAAVEVLSRFTDPSGLRPLAREHNVVFELTS